MQQIHQLTNRNVRLTGGDLLRRCMLHGLYDCSHGLGVQPVWDRQTLGEETRERIRRRQRPQRRGCIRDERGKTRSRGAPHVQWLTCSPAEVTGDASPRRLRDRTLAIPTNRESVQPTPRLHRS